MTDPDIVAELDRWLTEPAFGLAQEERELLQRARDEIVALRERNRQRQLTGSMIHGRARAEALEEAAQAVLEMPLGAARGQAAIAIRALRDKL